MAGGMVVIDGVRYRREDAERLGLESRGMVPAVGAVRSKALAPEPAGAVSTKAAGGRGRKRAAAAPADNDDADAGGDAGGE